MFNKLLERLKRLFQSKYILVKKKFDVGRIRCRVQFTDGKSCEVTLYGHIYNFNNDNNTDNDKVRHVDVKILDLSDELFFNNGTILSDCNKIFNPLEHKVERIDIMEKASHFIVGKEKRLRYE